MAVEIVSARTSWVRREVLEMSPHAIVSFLVGSHRTVTLKTTLSKSAAHL